MCRTSDKLAATPDVHCTSPRGSLGSQRHQKGRSLGCLSGICRQIAFRETDGTVVHNLSRRNCQMAAPATRLLTLINTEYRSLNDHNHKRAIDRHYSSKTAHKSQSAPNPQERQITHEASSGSDQFTLLTSLKTQKASIKASRHVVADTQASRFSSQHQQERMHPHWT